MDVAFILDKYFKGTRNVSIDVFDAQTLNAVYRDVVKAMTSHFEIEVSVLQALSYCLYEMMDNVHIHSGKPLGTAMTQYDDSQKTLRILIADDGMGIRASLAENEQYKDAIVVAGGCYFLGGFGRLFSDKIDIAANGPAEESVGKAKEYMLKTYTQNQRENGFWQGTLIYMEIGTGEEIDPNQVVDHRADAAEEYNEAFVETEELESLW